MANAELKNWPGVEDLRPILKKDTFWGKDFEPAGNFDLDLYVSPFDNVEEMREQAHKAFAEIQP